MRRVIWTPSPFISSSFRYGSLMCVINCCHSTFISDKNKTFIEPLLSERRMHRPSRRTIEDTRSFFSYFSLALLVVILKRYSRRRKPSFHRIPVLISAFNATQKVVISFSYQDSIDTQLLWSWALWNITIRFEIHGLIHCLLVISSIDFVMSALSLPWSWQCYLKAKCLHWLSNTHWGG